MKKRVFVAVIVVQAVLLGFCAGFFFYGRAGEAVALAAGEVPLIPTENQSYEHNDSAAANVEIYAYGENSGLTESRPLAADETYTSEAPADLTALQAASDGQLDYWAEHLTRFDGRDYGYITKAKNQSSYSICWAYAAVGTVEASILREGINPEANADNLDFDEYVAAYLVANRDGKHDPLMLTTGDTFSGNWNVGGYPDNALAAMTQGFSPVGETGSYYPDDQSILSHVVPSEYYIQSYKRFPATAEEIKRAIMRYGAVTVEYKAPSGYDNRYVYYADGRATNHASVIVGWDDSVASGNFAPDKPGGNGAWIVKNSWGAHGFPYKGVYCFYLSYESYLVNGVYAVDVAMKSDYQNQYFYDGGLANSGRNYLAEAQAAIYEAKMATATEREQLSAVSVVCPQSDLTLNIKIYKDLTVNPGNVNDEMNIPTQGDPVAEKTVHTDRMGLYTIDLDEPIDLEQGEYFSVVVSSRGKYDYVPIPCAVDGTESVNDMTYHYYDGVWKSYKYSSYYADTSTDCMAARIHALTKTVPRAVPLGNDLSVARVEIPNRLIYYAPGKKPAPEISVYFGGELLKENRDYTVRIEDKSTPGTVRVEIKGAGDYFGTRETSFEIGKPKYPPGRIDHTVKVYDNITRLHDIPIPVDWDWIDGDRLLEYGMSTFAVSLKYVGDDAEFYQIKTCDFYVEKIKGAPPETDISPATVDLGSGRFVYTGEPIVPDVTVTLGGLVLNAGVDYTISCTNNVRPGTANYTITGRNGYKGEKSGTFEIERAARPRFAGNTVYASRKARTLADVDIGAAGWRWANPAENFVGNMTATIIYDAADKDCYVETELEVTVRLMEREEIGSLAGLTLERLSYVYDGSEKCPSVVARDGSVTLEAGVDFTVTYVGNVGAGQASALVTGMGDYKGTATLAFTIEKAPRSGLAVSMAGWTFGGEATEPSVTGIQESAAVTYAYAASASGPFSPQKPTNAGSYLVRATVAASANYAAASVDAPFSIAPKDIGSATLIVEGEFVRTGNPITPEVTVRDGQAVLTKGVDFTVTYENNVSAGEASVTVRGMGNYTGTLVGSFTIGEAASGGNEENTQGSGEGEAGSESGGQEGETGSESGGQESETGSEESGEEGENSDADDRRVLTIVLVVMLPAAGISAVCAAFAVIRRRRRL